MKLRLLLLALVLTLLFSHACQRQPPSVEFINYTEHDICQIRTSRPHKREWGPNLLKDEVLAIQDRYRIYNLEPGMIDFRFVPCDETAHPLDYYGAIIEYNTSHRLVFPLGLSSRH